MSVCGYNTAARRRNCETVRGWTVVTCLRCLTVMLLRLNREGRLK